jgi:hypothetical protein
MGGLDGRAVLEGIDRDAMTAAVLQFEIWSFFPTSRRLRCAS